MSASAPRIEAQTARGVQYDTKNPFKKLQLMPHISGAPRHHSVAHIVRAERDGALAVVCAPIVAPTIEKILSIPVSRVIPTTSVLLAIDRLKDLV